LAAVTIQAPDAAAIIWFLGKNSVERPDLYSGRILALQMESADGPSAPLVPASVDCAEWRAG